MQETRPNEVSVLDLLNRFDWRRKRNFPYFRLSMPADIRSLAAR
jgi:hypothetical protein